MVSLQHPAWLQGLVLLATSARLRVSPAILEGLDTDPDSALQLLARLSLGADIPSEYLGLNSERRLACPPQVMRTDFLACDGFDLRPRLEDITLPALIISGDRDEMTPLRFGQELEAGLPAGRLVTVSGGGHFMAWEYPELVAGEIGRFVDELAAS